MSDPPQQGRARWAAAGLIVAATLPQFLLGLGDRHIWIPLEARYALVAREMLEAGHWLLPHLGGEVYADKPPLLFWAIALLSAFESGVTEWTARLPTALAAIGVCLLTWRLGENLFSPTAGLLAALVLATCGGFFWSGRQALPDMLLTLWTTGAICALWEWFTARRHWLAPVAGLCMGLATLTKGPVGVVLPTLVALLYYLMPMVHRQRPTLYGLDVLLAFGTFLSTTLLWFGPAVAQGGVDYARATLLHHTLERYVSAWEHTAPWYFYLGAFPAELLPWTLFLPQALLAGIKLPPQADREGWGFAICWLVAILGFFSLSTGKRDIYILPAFPAAALLVGWMWSRWWRLASRAAPFWAMSFPAILLAVTLWVLAFGIWGAASGLLPRRTVLLLPETREMSVWGSLLLVLSGTLLAGAAVARRTRLLYASTVGCTWLAMLMTVVWVYTPQFNDRYPIKPFVAEVRMRVEDPTRSLQLCGPLNDLALRFNLGDFLPEVQSFHILNYLERNEKAFCIIEAEWYQDLGERTGRFFPILARRKFDHATLLLISNR